MLLNTAGSVLWHTVGALPRPQEVHGLASTYRLELLQAAMAPHHDKPGAERSFFRDQILTPHTGRDYREFRLFEGVRLSGNVLHIVTLHPDSYLLQTTLPAQSGSGSHEGWIYLHNAHAVAMGPTAQASSWIRHRKSWAPSAEPPQGPTPAPRRLRRTTPMIPQRLAPAPVGIASFPHPTHPAGGV